MTQATRTRSTTRERYVRDLSSAWHSRLQTFDPSLWLNRDPDAEEKMMNDADIAFAIDHRRRLVAGRQWTLMPRVEAGTVADLAVSVGTELMGGIEHFTQARYQLARAFFSGQRFAHIHSTARTMTIGDGKPRTWLVPTRLVDQDKRMYRQASKDGGKTAYWERWNIAESIWEVLPAIESIRIIKHLYDDDQASMGYGRALREALGWWWYAKSEVFSESLQAVERYAQGTIIAEVDGLRDADSSLPNTEVYSKYIDKLENMRARHTLVHDSGDKISMLEMSGTGAQMMADFRKELRDTIFTLVLGANLPTNASEGGSFALASIQENSTEALLQFDRESLEETLTSRLLGWCWYANHANLSELGIANEKPRFNITQEKILDPEVRARVATQASQMGLALAKEELYEQFGFRKPEDDEEILAPQPAPAMGQPGLPFGGFSK